jgi:LmbE family N-acetylglucosaminyl deacetylase
LYRLLTRGEAGIDGIPPEQSAAIREAEKRETARVVGVDTAEFLGLADGVLEYGIRAMWVDGSPDTRGAVDITDTFEPGVESLKAHRKYLDRRGWEKFDPAESLEGLARQTGSRLGVPMTVGLDVHDLGGG